MPHEGVFVLLVEGHSEYRALGPFLERWLSRELGPAFAIEVQPDRCSGESDYRNQLDRKVRAWAGDSDVIAIIGLVDLYGLGVSFPRNDLTVAEKVAVARESLVALVPACIRDSFRQHFAVHELEAWLLSAPELLPVEIRADLPSLPPEDVDFDEPPAKLLDRLYALRIGRRYKKVREAERMFPQLDPVLVADRCPHFRAMVEDMKALALAAFGEEK